MKKTWVKRENIYYKPFYKHKSKMLLLGIFLLGIIFLIYQALSINQLPSVSTPFSLVSTIDYKGEKYVNTIHEKTAEQRSNSTKGSEHIEIIRGIRLFDYDNYKPNFDGNFLCLDGSIHIPFSKVNDDFCDCISDGSDEPSTNACNSGKFYCLYQKRHITGRGRDVFISSSRVNDGICDCCDGSDEWTTRNCPNSCV